MTIARVICSKCGFEVVNRIDMGHQCNPPTNPQLKVSEKVRELATDIAAEWNPAKGRGQLAQQIQSSLEELLEAGRSILKLRPCTPGSCAEACPSDCFDEFAAILSKWEPR